MRIYGPIPADHWIYFGWEALRVGFDRLSPLSLGRHAENLRPSAFPHKTDSTHYSALRVLSTYDRKGVPRKAERLELLALALGLALPCWSFASRSFASWSFTSWSFTGALGSRGRSLAFFGGGSLGVCLRRSLGTRKRWALATLLGWTLGLGRCIEACRCVS